nr:MAG TPA: hypothetical protein [Caudoviricetes sp.]
MFIPPASNVLNPFIYNPGTLISAIHFTLLLLPALSVNIIPYLYNSPLLKDFRFEATIGSL